MHLRRIVAATVVAVAAVACEPDRGPPPAPELPVAVPTSRSPVPEERDETLVLVRARRAASTSVSTREARAIIRGDPATLERLDVRVVRGPSAARPDVAREAEAIREAVADRRVIAVVSADAVTPAVETIAVNGVDPILRPGEYPLRDVRTPAPEVLRVTIVGDIMMGRRVGDAMAARGDFAYPLRHVAPILRRADLTVGNLESTLSRSGRPTQGGDSFGADPRVRRALRLAGFDALSLANNHTGDFGAASLVRTVELLRAGGFAVTGAGANAREARRPVVLERGGVRFGIIAFNAIGETPSPSRSRPGATRIRMQPRLGPLVERDLARVLADVRALRERVDVVLVLPHWGYQYTTAIHPDQRRVARVLIRAGADAVVGGHSHWVQGTETHRRAPIVYSLGNFVFDMDFSREVRRGAVAELVFWGSALKQVRYRVVEIGDDHAPRFVSGARARPFLSRLSRPPVTRPSGAT